MLTATIPSVIRFNDARLIDPTKSFKKKILLPGQTPQASNMSTPGAWDPQHLWSQMWITSELMCSVQCFAVLPTLRDHTRNPLSCLFVEAATSIQLPPVRPTSSVSQHQVTPAQPSNCSISAVGHLQAFVFQPLPKKHLLESAHRWMVCDPPPFLF